MILARYPTSKSKSRIVFTIGQIVFTTGPYMIVFASVERYYSTIMIGRRNADSDENDWRSRTSNIMAIALIALFTKANSDP